MVRCARYLQIMREDGLVESAARVGCAFKDGLERLQGEFPSISNVRGRGLLLAFDLPDKETRNRLRQRCWDEGLATLPCGPQSLRFRPPLVFSEAEVERSLGILRKVLVES